MHKVGKKRLSNLVVFNWKKRIQKEVAKNYEGNIATEVARKQTKKYA